MVRLSNIEPMALRRRRSGARSRVSARRAVCVRADSKSAGYRYDDADRETDNGVTDRWGFDLTGDIVKNTRTGGSQSKDQVYTYDKNGNRTTDERGTYAFGARDQLARWTTKVPTNEGTGDKKAVDYTVDPAGQTLKKVDERKPPGEETTTYTYLGDRLDKVTSKDQGVNVTDDYEYNQFGDVLKVKRTAAGQTLTTAYEYDLFERLKKIDLPNTNDEVVFTYDGLDRRDTRTVEGQGYDLAYVGMSEKLSREEVKPSGGSATATVKSYDYDSRDQRQGLATKPAGSPAAYRAYGKDVTGSTEDLENSSGDTIPGTNYKYDPFGDFENDTPNTGPSSPLSQTGKDNPFRFQGFYFDEGQKAYDMQARPYQPQIGRFLTRDRYEGANGDLALLSDPLTSSRYAFAGGNPIGRIEDDGHYACTATCSGRTPTDIPYIAPASPGVARQRARTIANRQVDAINYATQVIRSEITSGVKRAFKAAVKTALEGPTPAQVLGSIASAGGADGLRLLQAYGPHIKYTGPQQQRFGPIKIPFSFPFDIKLGDRSNQKLSDIGYLPFGGVLAKGGFFIGERVFLAVNRFREARKAVSGAEQAAKPATRLAQDVGVNPDAPAVLSTTRSIGRASHNARLQDDIAALPSGATDIRVNQQQVNALGQRVGINRPDLQYTLNGRRHFIEYEGPGNPRGAAHRARVTANDPNAAFDLRIVP